MSVSTEDASRRPLESSRKSRPAPELVVEAFFGPVADRLVLALLPLRVPPTALVLANAATALLAALAIAQDDPVLAALLLQMKTVLDNADGQLARASGRVTLLGRYLDTVSDIATSLVLLATLGYVTGQLWLGIAAFGALMLLLTVVYNLTELHREARGVATRLPESTGSRVERVLERVYQVVFWPQDRVVRAISSSRFERILGDEEDPRRRRAAQLAYHDRLTVAVLANLGLSTQLAVLGACLVLSVPEAYLWIAVASLALVPLLQLRRERLARRVLANATHAG